MPAPSPPFKTILELVLWNGLQSCRFITPDVINVIKMPFKYQEELQTADEGVLFWISQSTYRTKLANCCDVRVI
jgi:hypothetical protein